MNPALIKRGIDDEEYSNACPTIGSLMIAHFSLPNPEQHNSIVYGADGLFFATNPSRRSYLRPEFRNEFDIYTNEENYEQRPTLWVLVLLMSPGHHLLLPVWRGRAFWNGPESDSDEGVGNLVHQMCLRQGLNVAQWYSFVCDQRIRKSDAASGSKKAN